MKTQNITLKDGRRFQKISKQVYTLCLLYDSPKRPKEISYDYIKFHHGKNPSTALKSLKEFGYIRRLGNPQGTVKYLITERGKTYLKALVKAGRLDIEKAKVIPTKFVQNWIDGKQEDHE